MDKQKLKKTKNDIIRELAKKEDITILDSQMVVNGLLDIIIDSVDEGYEVNLSGFGRFIPKRTVKRRVIHPSSGEATYVNPYNTMLFSASGKVKEILNGEEDE